MCLRDVTECIFMFCRISLSQIKAAVKSVCDFACSLKPAFNSQWLLLHIRTLSLAVMSPKMNVIGVINHFLRNGSWWRIPTAGEADEMEQVEDIRDDAG